MAESSRIEWTDATWNPVTGCTMVSAGCTNCYAMGLAAGRLRNHPSRAGLTRGTGGRAVWTGEVRLNEGWLDQPLRWTGPRRIFVCAHGDLFHEAVPDEWIDRVFAVMAMAGRHTFQVLTKRPERMRAYLAHPTVLARICLAAPTIPWAENLLIFDGRWPIPHIWLGTSVEDQATADARIPELLATPAAVRFVSAEPLLGPVELRRFLVEAPVHHQPGGPQGNPSDGWIEHRPALSWIIAGGESGPGARPMHPDWARGLRDQCAGAGAGAGVAFFMKQMARKAPIPADLLVREWPHG